MNNIKTFENFNNQDIFKYIYNDDVQSVKNYIDAGYDLNIKNINGYTALILAAKNNNYKIVNILLKKCADVNIQNYYNYNALIAAVYNKNMKMTKIILNSNIDIDKEYINGYTALTVAADNNDRELVELLLDYGADEFILAMMGYSFYDLLNAKNKKYFLEKYPNSVYNAIYHNYKKSFTEFVKDYNIK